MSPWWLGFPPAETTVACRRDRHRLRWEAGALRAVDHDDPEAERTLAALGGERYTCVDVLDAWTRHADDLRVLTLASRGPTDPLALEADPPARRLPRGMLRAQLGSAGRAPFPHPHALPATPDDDFVTLLGLGGGLADRLVATVAAAHREPGTAPHAQLYAALYGRALATLRAWLGQPTLDVELELADAPSLTRREDKIRAELPFAWLVDVWARGLGTVFGRFCLGATTADGDRWTLATVGPDLGDPLPVTIHLS